MRRLNLFVCPVVFVVLLTWSNAVSGSLSSSDEALREKLRSMHEKVRQELLSGELSYMTINKLRFQTDLMDKSGDEKLVFLAKEIKKGYVDYPSLLSYLESKGPRYLNNVYSTLLRSFEVLAEPYDL